ncbi:MAG: cell filamentation protein Fic [Bacteroidetes bacterium SW_9_63_38]|nr:MAG: cell filamentation protein Fic [Bacteroidetes bacterium SW_9_63_38]
MQTSDPNDELYFDDYEAGHSRQQTEYESFLPTPINHGWNWTDARINTLLEEAARALSELNAFSRIIPDIDLFVQLHVVKEANASSRIEGTRTEMEDAIRPEEAVPAERWEDWNEVQNYVRAMQGAIDALDDLPLSTRLPKQTHETLMEDVRGQHRNPGEYRKSQNWIGGSSLEDAVFIPPPHHRIPELMSDLERFWHNDAIQVPHLIRIAISHYQFETIHPFLDGDGRIGRLLITLYLISKGLLNQSSLYLSSYIDAHRSAYYRSLSRVRETDDLGQWIRFFLVAVRETARQGRDTFDQILDLRKDAEAKAASLGRKAGNARRLLTLLYQQPFVNAKDVTDHLDVTHATALSLLDDFEDLDLLEETTGRQRNRRYLFSEYVDLFTRE